MQIQLESFPRESRRGHFAFWIAILIVIIGAAFDYWDRKRVNNLRALSLEEQETIFAAIDRAAIQHRLDKNRTQQLRARINNPALPAFVDTGMSARRLLYEESKMLLFSPNFFDADPISQENSLISLARLDLRDRSR